MPPTNWKPSLKVTAVLQNPGVYAHVGFWWTDVKFLPTSLIVLQISVFYTKSACSAFLWQQNKCCVFNCAECDLLQFVGQKCHNPANVECFSCEKSKQKWSFDISVSYVTYFCSVGCISVYFCLELMETDDPCLDTFQEVLKKRKEKKREKWI